MRTTQLRQVWVQAEGSCSNWFPAVETWSGTSPAGTGRSPSGRAGELDKQIYLVTISENMTPAQTMFRLDDDIRQAMEDLKERDGTPFNTQANKALRVWLEQKGVLEKRKPARK